LFGLGMFPKTCSRGVSRSCIQKRQLLFLPSNNVRFGFARRYLSTSKPFIPLIDLSDSFISANGKAKAAEEVAEACRTVGFFSIVGHNVDPKVMNDTWELTRSYFDQPAEEKMKVPMTPDYPYGYDGMESESLAKGYGDNDDPPDLNESFCIGPYNPAAGMAAPMWPEYPSGFSSAWLAYYKELEKLSQHMLSLFALGLKLDENFFAGVLSHHRSALRALNYPEQTKPPLPNQIRAGAHTDYGALTILRQDDVGGLQALNRNKEWQEVEYTPDSFVINLGDLMQNWTNDLWVSNAHRVINKSPRRRQSMAFFCNINHDHLVECIPTCQSPENPAKYPPILAWDHLISKHTASVEKK